MDRENENKLGWEPPQGNHLIFSPQFFFPFMPGLPPKKTKKGFENYEKGPGLGAIVREGLLFVSFVNLVEFTME